MGSSGGRLDRFLKIKDLSSMVWQSGKALK